MSDNVPRDHHYAPQFYLRNFATDQAKRKIMTVAKHGDLAIWAERSIESLGFERDLYVHTHGGVPVSVETVIGQEIETPISQSETWGKISSGRADLLDRSDKPILYALIRHLDRRTPHSFATTMELAEMAADPSSNMPFDDEEREYYALLRADPENARALFNFTSSSMEWTIENYFGCFLSILRSPIPLRSSTTPVMSLSAPPHPALHLPLPGMVPFQLALTLNPSTMALLVLGNFDDAFVNSEIDFNIARVLNRHRVGQFAHFDHVRHVITDRHDLIDDMTWAPFDLLEDTERKITFRRRPTYAK